MGGVFTDEERQSFADRGYIVARGILDEEIGPFREASIAYLDELTAALGLHAIPGIGATLPDLPFQKRLAVLLGATGGNVLSHLDPLLNLSLPHFRLRDDLPSAQTPSLFALMRNEKLLDAVEGLIGPEIVASATYHMNTKLPVDDLALASEAATRNGQKLPAHGVWNFAAGGATPWHSDGHHALPGADRITAWIPLTEATLESGCLKMVPGSQKLGAESEARANPDEAVPLPTGPGDVIFFDHWTLHGADANKAAGHLRWAVNFRYHAAAAPSDTVHLPSFVARSRADPSTELHDPALWAAMWQSGLRYLERHLVPTRPNLAISAEDADRLRRIWPVRLPRHGDWRRLGEPDFPDADTAQEIAGILRLSRRPARGAAG